MRVRILVDDSDGFARDKRMRALTAHPRIEVRLFNPYAYRGPLAFGRSAVQEMRERGS